MLKISALFSQKNNFFSFHFKNFFPTPLPFALFRRTIFTVHKTEKAERLFSCSLLSPCLPPFKSKSTPNSWIPAASTPAADWVPCGETLLPSYLALSLERGFPTVMNMKNYNLKRRACFHQKLFLFNLFPMLLKKNSPKEEYLFCNWAACTKQEVERKVNPVIWMTMAFPSCSCSDKDRPLAFRRQTVIRCEGLCLRETQSHSSSALALQAQIFHYTNEAVMTQRG